MGFRRKAGPVRPVRLIHGDCKDVLPKLVGQTFHLIYIDPPFFSNDTYTVPELGVAFDDKWQSIDQYVWQMRLVFRAAKELLAPEGCLIVHCDHHASHYLKVELDRVFSPKQFASEIIWRYRRWPSASRNLQRMHDTLLRYVAATNTKTTEPRFVQHFEPQSASTLSKWGDKKQSAVLRPDGSRRRSAVGEEVSPGVALCDVWEIPMVAPNASERNGYPTQKPTALMKRLLEVFTVPGDRVLDPMCGSGSMLEAALQMGRPVVGIDKGKVAMTYAQKRLEIEAETF